MYGTCHGLIIEPVVVPNDFLKIPSSIIAIHPDVVGRGSERGIHLNFDRFSLRLKQIFSTYQSHTRY